MSSEVPSSESLLVAYADRGDEVALSTLVERHWPHAYRVALRSLADPSAAEDAAQEAMVALLRGAARFDRRASFLPWFRALVLNAVRMAARARGRRLHHERVLGKGREEGVRDEAGERRLLAEEVTAQLAALPDDYRSALVLHYAEGLTHEEVAAALRCPKGTAATRIRRGRERLRESLVRAGHAVVLADLERWLVRAGASAAEGTVPPAPSGAVLGVRAGRLARRTIVRRAAAIVGLGSVIAVSLLVALPRRSERDEAPPPSTTARASGGEQHRDASVARAPAPTAPPGDRVAASDEPRGGATPSRAAGPVREPTGAGDDRPRATVRVIDEVGAPVAGAWVVTAPILRPEFNDAFDQEPEDPSRAARTDAAGRTLVTHRGPECVVLARIGDRRGRTRFVRAAPQDELTIVVRPPARPAPERGSVVIHFAPEVPTAGTRVVARVARAIGWGRVDAGGLYVLPELEPGSCELRFLRVDGFVTPGPVRMTVEPGRLVDVDVALTGEGAIVGAVAGPDGRAAAGVEVEASLEEEQGGARCSSSAESDAAGRYRVGSLRAGRYRVVARAPGLAAAPAEHVLVSGPGEIPGPSFGLVALAALSGRVLDAEGGAPIVGARVFIGAEVLETGADGSFRGSAPVAGDRVLVLAAGFTSEFVDAAAAVGQASIDLGEIRLARRTGAAKRTRVCGRAFGPDGPVAGASLFLREEGSADALGCTTSGLDGAFAFDPVAPPGRLLVSGRAPDGRVLSETLLEATGGAELRTELRFAPGGSIEGRVVGDARGLEIALEPIERARCPADPRPLATSADGRFLVTGLAPGRYRARAVAGALGDGRVLVESSPIEVAAGRTAEVELAMPEGTGRLRVTVKDGRPLLVAASRGSPLETGEEPIARAVIPEADGSFLLVGLPAGSITVLAVDHRANGDRAVLQGAEVVAGVERPVRIEWPDPRDLGSITGRISPARSAPVAAVGERVVASSRCLDDGSFSLEGLPAGLYRVSVLPAARGGSAAWPKERSVLVEVRSGEAAHIAFTDP